MTYVREIVPPHIHAARDHALPRHRVHSYTGVHPTSPALRAHRTHHTYPKTKKYDEEYTHRRCAHTYGSDITRYICRHAGHPACGSARRNPHFGDTSTAQGHGCQHLRAYHIARPSGAYTLCDSIGQGDNHRHHGRRHGTLLSEESARRPMYHCRRSHRLLYGRAAGCNETQQDRRA